MMDRDIVIRRAQESDGEFAYQTVERTMRGYALAILGKWGDRRPELYEGLSR
jgi:hypothetical protein